MNRLSALNNVVYPGSKFKPIALGLIDGIGGLGCVLRLHRQYLLGPIFKDAVRTGRGVLSLRGSASVDLVRLAGTYESTFVLTRRQLDVQSRFGCFLCRDSL